MTVYRYELVEYDLERPWVVVASDHQTVELPDGQKFEPWAQQQFPGDRYRVLLVHETVRWPTAAPDE
jgi:hypothetical protein